MIFGPVYDPVTPEWKKLAFASLILAAGLVIYVCKSKPQGRFLTSVLLAIIVVLFVSLILFFH